MTAPKEPFERRWSMECRDVRYFCISVHVLCRLGVSVMLFRDGAWLKGMMSIWPGKLRDGWNVFDVGSGPLAVVR